MKTEIVYPNDINGNDRFFVMDGLHFMPVNTMIEYISDIHEWDEWYVVHVSFKFHENICEVLVSKTPD